MACSNAATLEEQTLLAEFIIWTEHMSGVIHEENKAMQLAAKCGAVTDKDKTKMDHAIQFMSTIQNALATGVSIADIVEEEEEEEDVQEKPKEEKEKLPFARLPEEFMVPAESLKDMSVQEVAWLRMYIASFRWKEMVHVFATDTDVNAAARRDFAVKQLTEKKLTFELIGDAKNCIRVTHNMRVCEEQRILAMTLHDIFTVAFKAARDKTDECSATIFVAQDAISLSALLKLGYLVDAQREKTIVTW